MAESKKTRELRLRRDRLFPDKGALVFDNTRSGFAPLPVLFRVILRAFRADGTHLRKGDFAVLAGLYCCREGQLNMVAVDLDALAYTVGLSSRHKVREPLDRLEALGFIATATDALQRWVLLLDPVHAVGRLYEHGLLDKEDLRLVNELLVTHDREPVPLPESDPPSQAVL